MSKPVFLLDTDTISDLVRRPQGSVAKRIAAVGEDAVATSIVVAAELRFGAQKRGSQALAARIDTILDLLPVLSLDQEADRHYAALRCDLEHRGLPIGGNDMLIAAHALALDAICVTGNLREFSRVSGLRAENWIAEHV